MRKINIIMILCLSLFFIGIISDCNSKKQKQVKKNNDKFSFAIIGDRTDDHKPGIYVDVIKEMNQLKPDIVLSIGDYIEGYTKNEEELEFQWKEFKEIEKLIDNPKHYYVCGNHDISGGFDKVMEKYFRKYMGEPQYTLSYKNTYFVFFDNSRWGYSKDLPDESIKWLKNKLKNKPKDNINTIVLMHRPYWIYYSEDKKDRIHEILKENKVDIVFTGHIHYYTSEKIDDIQYISIGTSGGDFGYESLAKGQFDHFFYGIIDGKNYDMSIIKKDSDFKKLPIDYVTKKQIEIIKKMEEDFKFEPIVKSNSDKEFKKETLKLYYSDSVKKETINSITWEIEDNWSIELDKNTESTKNNEINYILKQKGQLYPLPIMKIPLNNKFNHNFKKAINIDREVNCPYTKENPTIDGEKEKLWDKALSISDLCRDRGYKSKAEKTIFNFMYSDNDLYVLVEANESDIKNITANSKIKDGSVRFDDSIGLFISPIEMQKDSNKEIKTVSFYDIFINTISNVYDIKKLGNIETSKIFYYDAYWNSIIESKTKIYKEQKKWIMEIKLNLKSIGISPNHKRFKINFQRRQMTQKAYASWLPVWDDHGIFVLES